MQKKERMKKIKLKLINLCTVGETDDGGWKELTK